MPTWSGCDSCTVALIVNIASLLLTASVLIIQYVEIRHWRTRSSPFSARAHRVRPSITDESVRDSSLLGNVTSSLLGVGNLAESDNNYLEIRRPEDLVERGADTAGARCTKASLVHNGDVEDWRVEEALIQTDRHVPSFDTISDPGTLFEEDESDKENSDARAGAITTTASPRSGTSKFNDLTVMEAEFRVYSQQDALMDSTGTHPMLDDEQETIPESERKRWGWPPGTHPMVTVVEDAFGCEPDWDSDDADPLTRD